jgi:hypothetical protein
VVRRATIARAVRTSLLSSAHVARAEVVERALRRPSLPGGRFIFRALACRIGRTGRANTDIFFGAAVDSEKIGAPVMTCRGTSPTDAAKSRLHPYCFGSPIFAVNAFAVTGPTHGVLTRRCPISFVSEITCKLLFNLFGLSSSYLKRWI